ncbi:MAG TPA: YslB family protein [Bacillota bacterium]|nr:YslB family protein [Bacillota bacterium]
MLKKLEPFSLSMLENLHTPGAGYDILRYISLPDLLGKESSTILYFMGKNLARKFEFETLEDIYYFFQQIGWGNLELVKERRRELIFHLLSDSVVHRLQAPFEADFRLEAGFLAEAIQQLEETECECIEDINHRIHQIRFKVIDVH